MSISKSRRRGAATIDLVICSVRAGRLHILVVKAAGGAPVLPYVWSTDGDPLEQSARALGREFVGSNGVWMVPGVPTSSKRHPAGAALSVPYVVVTGPSVPAPAGAAWYPMDALPALSGRHKTIAETVLETLRLHMDASPVAFRLLPATFTLSDLQQVYELLLGRRLHKASFRRALQAAYLVEPMDEWRSEGRGRPAQLFRYSPRKRRGGHRSVRFDLIGR